MPKLKSAKKSLKKNQVQRFRNKTVMTAMRSAIKSVHGASADKESATAALGIALSVIDHSASRGVIHRNTAARYKSRLTKRVQAIA